MNLALIGYGKMGRLIEELATARGHRVAFKVDIDENRDGQALTEQNLRGVDVAIDFTTPEAVVRSVERVTDLGVNMVVGTTGWMNQLEAVRSMVEAKGVGFVYGSNFSIGVNLFFRLMEAAAAQFRQHSQYDPWIYEIHHRAKLDAPSGTALKLKQILEKAYEGREVSTASNRAGAIPGEHTVGFDSEADTLTFTHTARSRLGFASGALHAAEWVRGKKGFYEFPDILSG
ncbi:MAG: 4-hydroxy-tetrahydrodipicolinate reductase [Acidobacteria bacterium]|nr:4-hydroxy-tetrahydrodipicolinate reductase [Acidobacteriota bacterium]MCZ6753183.1 4-hydroxy-tetrahydrodipicolinate reductase [Acidobacteriota bacterium]